MPKFSPTFIQDLLDRTSIVELVRTYVQLQKKGSTWKGLCPFHQEKTPSFVVNEGRSEVGVPWFRKIPIFGWLFKQQNITNQNRELLIFITPKIMRLA